MQAYKILLRWFILTLTLFLSVLSNAKDAADATDFCYISSLTGGSCTQLPENKDKQETEEFSTTIQNLFFNVLSSTNKPTIISAYPNNLPQNSEASLLLSGSDVDFNDSSSLSFDNSNIVVKETLFISKNKLQAIVMIPSDTEIKYYSATVKTQWGDTQKIATGKNILSITQKNETPYIINIAPNRIASGVKDIDVLIYGHKTHFTENSLITFPNSNISVKKISPINDNTLRASLSLDSNTKKGIYNIKVITGGEQARNKDIGILTIFDTLLHPTIESITPSYASKGDKNISLTVTAKDTNFNQGTDLTFKSTNINVKSIDVINKTTLEVFIDIADNASLGGYDVFTFTGNEVTSSIDGFRVYPPEKITLTPYQAHKNETVKIMIKGENIHFTDKTKVILDPNSGITLNSQAIINNHTIEAEITITNTAKLGEHVLSIKTGEQVAVKAFTVQQPISVITPPPPTLKSISPKQGKQSDKVIVTIEGKNTYFTSKSTVNINPKDRINITDLTVINPQKLQATLNIDKDALVGLYDISVTAQGNKLTLQKAFTVNQSSTPDPDPTTTPDPDPTTTPDPDPTTAPDPDPAIVPDTNSNKILSLVISGKGSIHIPSLNIYCNEQHCNDINISEENNMLIAINSSPNYEFLEWGGQCSGKNKQYTLASTITEEIIQCIAIFTTKNTLPHAAICPSEGRINHTCTSYNNKINNAYIESKGIIDEAVFSGITINHGRIKDSAIARNSTLTGTGILAGIILNKGTIKNIEFTGSHLMGGTLSGLIINSSTLKYSVIRDVSLEPFTILKGRSLAGYIIGHPKYPARLESLTITPYTYLEHVTIMSSVKVENNVIFGKGVKHEIALVAQKGRNNIIQEYMGGKKWLYAKDSQAVSSNITSKEILHYDRASTGTKSGLDEAYITSSFNNQQYSRPIYPIIANNTTFYSEVEEDTTYYEDGFISFTFNNKRYQGRLSYFIEKSSPIPSLSIQSIDDKNQDNIPDFIINYPTGERQILLNLDWPY